MDSKLRNNQTPLDKVIEWIGEKLSVIFLFIVAITFYEVFVRYLFDSPTIWVHELAIFLGGSLFVLGGAYALANDKHVRVVLFYDNVKPKTRIYLNIFHHIMGLVFSAMMVWASWRMAKESWFKPWGDLQLETSGTAWDTHFPAYLKAIIFITMVTLTIQFILKLLVEIRLLLGGRHV
ncbi:MAG: C4-dicarboxylate ABC transporter permease [Gammaproteobacteria bacterium]|nr:MAG: C4-dicarboxylate ABC transporter permease [Gammaproteobacteria bacterium]